MNLDIPGVEDDELQIGQDAIISGDTQGISDKYSKVLGIGQSGSIFIQGIQKLSKK